MMLTNIAERQSYNLQSLQKLKLDTRLLDKLEWVEVRNQVEIVCSFLPDILLDMDLTKFNVNEKLQGHVIIGKISRITDLCLTYNKECGRGIDRLKEFLNAYFSCLVEIIYFYNGDLVSITPNEFVAIWKQINENLLDKTTQDVFLCALSIQKFIGNFKADGLDFLIEIKEYVGFGNLIFTTLGTDVCDYFLHSEIMDEGRNYLEATPTNSIVIGKILENFVNDESHRIVRKGPFLFLEEVQCTVEQSILYESKFKSIRHICAKHFMYGLENNSEKLDRNLLERYVTKFTPLKTYYLHLRNYVFPRVYEMTDNNFSLGRLTCFEHATIQIVVLEHVNLNKSFVISLQFRELYDKLAKIAYNNYGMTDKVRFEKNSIILTFVYGFKNLKTYILVQNALKAAMLMKKELDYENQNDGNDNENNEAKFKFAIAMGEGCLFTAVLGHPDRKVYFNVTYVVKKLMDMVKQYPEGVLCDYNVYAKARVSTSYFQELETADLDIDYVFLLKEEAEDILDIKPILVGRSTELKVMQDVITTETEYAGICFFGKVQIGKTKLLESATYNSKQDGHVVTSLRLPEGPHRPYFCVSLIYKQLYNIHANFGSEFTKLIECIPSTLWNLTNILQSPSIDKNENFKMKVEIFTNLRNLISLNPKGFAVIIIDDVQYLDFQSLEMMQVLIEEGLIKLICAGTFSEEPSFEIRYKLSLSGKIKIIELGPVGPASSDEIVQLILNVSGEIPRNLSTFLQQFCGGSPGLIVVAVKDFLKKGIIEIMNDEVVFVIEKLPKEEMTFQSIYCDLLLSFSTNEQSVITTSVVLGRIFKRKVLKSMLDDPPDAFLALAMIHLFEAGIFDCASKYLTGNTLDFNPNECRCCLESKVVEEMNFQVGYTLPRYAHCELIYFKDNHVRKVVYDVIESTERDQLHQQLLEILEDQDMRCTTCQTNNLMPTFSLETFTTFLQGFNDPRIVYSEENDVSDIDKEPDYIKNIIRREMRKFETQEYYNNHNKNFNLTHKLKKLDTNLCFCLDYLLRTYSYLVENSAFAGHEAKRIFFIHNLSSVYLSLGEYQQASDLLKETVDLLVNDKSFSSSKFAVSDNLKLLMNAKTRRMLGEVCYLEENYEQAKDEVSWALRELKNKTTSLFPQSQSLVEKIVSKTFLRKIALTSGNKPQSFAVIFRQELALCYDLTCRIFRKLDNRQVALMCCIYSYHFIGKNSLITNDYLKIHRNTFETCCAEATPQICKKLIQDSLLLLTNLNDKTKTLFCDTLVNLLGLLMKVFELSVLNGDVLNATILGFNLLNVLEKLGAYKLLTTTASTLTSSLLIIQKIRDAVSIIKFVQNLGRTISCDILLIYHTFCLELYLETGFSLTGSLEKTFEYAESLPKNQSNKSDVEIRFLILLYQFYLRTSRYNEAMRIKSQLNNDEIRIEVPSYIGVTNIIRYTECLMISFARKLSDSLSEKTICKQYLENLKSVSAQWPLFLSRYLHYKAYYHELTGKKRAVRKILAEASFVAQKQGNILESAWIIASDDSWRNFRTINEYNEIEWQQASTYTPLEWSQVMFHLPSYSYS